MAMPTSAALSAGASLTPSPVMATTLSMVLRAATIFIFCSGEVRAKMRTPPARRVTSSACFSRSSTSPVSSRLASASGGTMQLCRATARAVSGWSPVIMMTSMPARWQVATAAGTSGRSGSSMPRKPARTRSRSSSASGVSAPASGDSGRQATAITRRPAEASRRIACSAAARAAASAPSVSPSPVRTAASSGRSASHAPLTAKNRRSPAAWTPPSRRRPASKAKCRRRPAARAAQSPPSEW